MTWDLTWSHLLVLNASRAAEFRTFSSFSKEISDILEGVNHNSPALRGQAQRQEILQQKHNAIHSKRSGRIFFTCKIIFSVMYKIKFLAEEDKGTSEPQTEIAFGFESGNGLDNE